MNNFYWIIEQRQLWALLFGVFFLLPMLRSPRYDCGQLVVVPASGIMYLWLIAVGLSIALTPEFLMGGDKMVYQNAFYSLASGRTTLDSISRDVLFYAWMRFVSFFTSNPTVFFLMTTAVYVSGYVLAFKRIGKTSWSVLMVAAVFGVGFFAYGDNTLRAGMAYSLLLVGISMSPTQKIPAILLAVCSFFIHHSMVIPICALIVALFYKNTKIIFAGWLVLLGIAIVFGNTTQEFLAGLFENAEDQRMTSYALGESDVYKQGFRTDFLIYGFVPIALGFYYRFRKHFEDPFYVWILNTYIITNGFWLLMIRAVFTDRFAYLSWGLSPIVLFYPLLKKRIWANQSVCIVGGLVLILLLNLILAFRNFFTNL